MTKLSLLFSYAGFRNIRKGQQDIFNIINANADILNIFIDSGAFTVYKQGIVIEVDEYANFIKNIMPIKPLGYFTLDVIGDEVKTKENYYKLLELGTKPIAIFTRGSDPKTIDEYYKTSEVIALGGTYPPGRLEYIKFHMNIIGDRKVHWLGYTGFDFIKHYKPYSCDSISWLNSLLYPGMRIYLGYGKWKSYDRKDWRMKTPNKRIYDFILKTYDENLLICKDIKHLRHSDNSFLRKLNYNGCS